MKEFTLCMWTKFHNHSNDHPLFSYAGECASSDPFFFPFTIYRRERESESALIAENPVARYRS